jgi:cytoskeletal protein CcmA (bactofilin family)
MFGKSTEPAVRNISTDKHSHTQSILQEGVVVRGEIDAKGDVRLDGRLEGKIKVSERLTVGAGGTVVADAEANEVIVMGSVEGTIRARQRLELRKGARVVGDICSPSLMIEEGVHFEGRSKMGDGKAQGPAKPEHEILAIGKKPQTDLNQAIS